MITNLELVKRAAFVSHHLFLSFSLFSFSLSLFFSLFKNMARFCGFTT